MRLARGRNQFYHKETDPRVGGGTASATMDEQGDDETKIPDTGSWFLCHAILWGYFGTK